MIDQLRAMQVFYVNVGGGEPTVRPDFWELLDYAVANQLGVKFSTNGLRLDAGRARRLAATDYVDVQVSLDGASRAGLDRRGPRRTAPTPWRSRAMENLAGAGFRELQDLRGDDPPQRAPAGRLRRPRRPLRRPAADRPAASRPVGGRTSRPSCTPTDHQQREIYCMADSATATGC